MVRRVYEGASGEITLSGGRACRSPLFAAPVIPIYFTIRFILALLCAAVFLRIRKSYFLISSISLLLPQSLYDPHYWRGIWLPIETVRFIAAVSLSAFLLRRSRHLSRQEHRAIIGFGLCAGIGVTLAAWLWRPENGFQMAVIIRQYLYFILCTLMTGWWVRHWVRPPAASPLAGYWCWWLMCATLMAAGGKGGLLREFSGWREGLSWQAIGIAGMLGQALIAALLAFHPGQSSPESVKAHLKTN
jgi:hypothetical protein